MRGPGRRASLKIADGDRNARNSIVRRPAFTAIALVVPLAFAARSPWRHFASLALAASALPPASKNSHARISRSRGSGCPVAVVLSAGESIYVVARLVTEQQRDRRSCYQARQARGRGRFLLRRVGAEAAGVFSGRFVAVSGRPNRATDVGGSIRCRSPRRSKRREPRFRAHRQNAGRSPGGASLRNARPARDDCSRERRPAASGERPAHGRASCDLDRVVGALGAVADRSHAEQQVAEAEQGDPEPQRRRELDRDHDQREQPANQGRVPAP